MIAAKVDELPIDPRHEQPTRPCPCGSNKLQPETDVMDTWATSSLTPQIVGRWSPSGNEQGKYPGDEELYSRVHPFNLRPQGHEIIRTWAFYTIVKSLYHYEEVPWDGVLISGWGIAGEGMGKISKSRGGGKISPLETINTYSADAVRYWAASTGPGKDAVISEDKIQLGYKLANKLWNVAVFCERFLKDDSASIQLTGSLPLTPADRWILAKSQRLIRQVTDFYRNYEYAAAKSEVEAFFWRDLADNYLEMCKQRLYNSDDHTRRGALYSLEQVFLIVLKLFAPLLPYVTEAIYQGLFSSRDTRKGDSYRSIHASNWPHLNHYRVDEQAENFGEELVSIATAVRRYKSELNLALGTQIERLVIYTPDHIKMQLLEDAKPDLASITRANHIEMTRTRDPELHPISISDELKIGIE